MLLLALAAAAAIAANQPCADTTFEGSRFTACRFDATRHELRLADGTETPLRSFTALSAALGPDRDRVLFAMNAGMFDQGGRPIGLYAENGATLHPLNRSTGPGNFYMQPNGVFSLDAAGLHIDATGAYSRQALWATQSGPMLLIDGKLAPSISEDGPSRHIRNAVCVLSPGDAVFAISDDAVSFGKLARFLRGRFACRDALYLDGAISSAWIPSQRRMDARAPLGPMVVVLKH